MDGEVFATSFGTGLAIGLSTMLIVTIIVFPISFVMNRYIYHNWAMRLLLGFLTVFFPIGSFFVAFALGWNRPAHYFGLFPLVSASENPPTPTGWFAFLFVAVRALLHPLSMFSDPTAYEKSVAHLLAGEGVATVNEEHTRAAIDAGAEMDLAKWQSQLASL